MAMVTVEERLREWIDGKTREFEAKGPDHLRGDSGWAVSLEEQAVFGLKPETMARVLAVFEAYQALAYGVDNALGGSALCAEARAAFPWIGQGGRGRQSDLDAFQRFAKMFGVAYRQSYAFYWKHAFHDVRSGMMRFPDETEAAREKALAEAAEWPDDHPRLRGLYPEPQPVGRASPQVLATISLDAELYEWLKGFVSVTRSFTSCVEETLDTALRGGDAPVPGGASCRPPAFRSWHFRGPAARRGQSPRAGAGAPADRAAGLRSGERGRGDVDRAQRRGERRGQESVEAGPGEKKGRGF